MTDIKVVSGMTSLLPPRRKFDSIEHEKLSFSIVKTLHSPGAGFKGNVHVHVLGLVLHWR